MENQESKIICDNCEVNPAETHLINGEEKKNLCSVCCQESLYSMAITNNELYICNNGTKDGLTELELQ